MPSILNATDASPAANAYCTAAYALTYLTTFRDPSNSNSAPFIALPTANQEAAIIWATAMLDQIMNWKGFRRTVNQALRWPRSGVQDPDFYYIGYDTVPEIVRQATAALAAELVANNRINEPAIGFQGFSELSVGTIRLKVERSNVRPLIPMYILAMLQYLGDVFALGEGGSSTVRLARS